MNRNDWKAAGAELAAWAKRFGQAALAVAGLLLVLGFVAGVTARGAIAATLTLDLPMCSSFAWDSSAAKLTCVTGTTPPPVTPPPVTPPPPPPPSSNPYAACPADAIIAGDVWGLANTQTVVPGRTWGDGQIFVYRVIPMAATSTKNSTWSPYSGGGGVRDYALSTKACSFDPADAVPTPYGGKAAGSGPYIAIPYRAGATVGGQVTLAIEGVYYLNLRNTPGSCASGNCVMVGGFPK